MKTVITHIYGLIDPRTNEIRYVGKTIKRIENRLKDHIRASNPYYGFQYRVCRWIRCLLRINLKPLAVLLQTVTGDKWVEAEKRWIKKLRKSGARLTNLTEGGDGCVGMKHSKKTVEKMRQRMTEHNPFAGKKHTEETRQLLREYRKKQAPIVLTPEQEERRRTNLIKRNHERAIRDRIAKGLPPQKEPKKLKTRQEINEAMKVGWAKRKESMGEDFLGSFQKGWEERQKKVGGKWTFSSEARKKISKGNKGKVLSEETKEKIAEARRRMGSPWMQGENNPNWKNKARSSKEKKS